MGKGSNSIPSLDIGRDAAKQDQEMNARSFVNPTRVHSDITYASHEHATSARRRQSSHWQRHDLEYDMAQFEYMNEVSTLAKDDSTAICEPRQYYGVTPELNRSLWGEQSSNYICLEHDSFTSAANNLSHHKSCLQETCVHKSTGCRVCRRSGAILKDGIQSSEQVCSRAKTLSLIHI